MLHRALLLGALALVLSGVSLFGEDAKKAVTVVIATPLGDIEVVLDPGTHRSARPISCATSMPAFYDGSASTAP